MIVKKWRDVGVPGTSQEVCDVMNALSGAVHWQKKMITNRDIVRLLLACEAMEVQARESIVNTALNAFGKDGINTTK